jgi:hypothetical protein
MEHIRNTPVRILLLMMICSCMISCEEQEPPEVQCEDGGMHYLRILPEDPTSEDTIIAIDSICGNETDVILDHRGQEITFKRYVNSLMMMPCRPRTDTTVIGQLNGGRYRIIHCLIDKNHLIADSVVLLDTLCLLVK